jgi:hypothetical protein
MRDITISVGEPATFDCQVIGQPKPDVYWTKDGRRVGESPRWKLIVEDDHYTMLIYEVHPEDAGLYECVVINKIGKATCSARLNVAGGYADCWRQLFASSYVRKQLPLNPSGRFPFLKVEDVRIERMTASILLMSKSS